MVDVNAIGAGGGSIAWLDGGGSLRVGPHSAGSEPGPACYGRGGAEPTVTDASVVLGYIDPTYFAGGGMPLAPAAARAAIETKIARPLGLTVEQAALGIHRVIDATMAEGIRFVSVKRGIDPRRFSLVALGGGGPVHATALAAELGIRRVIVPAHPGVLSAAGLLAAPVEHQAAVAFNRPLAGVDCEALARHYAALDARCDDSMQTERVDPAAIRRHYLADVCYVGQSYHLEVDVHLDDAAPLERLAADFYQAHDRIYGHSTPGPIQFVNLRAVHQAQASSHDAGLGSKPVPGESLKGRRPILTAGASAFCSAPVYERTRMPAGLRFEGPAIVEQADTTTVVEPGWRGEIDRGGTLILTPAD